MFNKDYGIEDVLMDLPFMLNNCGEIYAVKVKDYKKFQRYLSYISFSINHLGLKDNNDLMKAIIWNHMATYNNGEMPEDDMAKYMLHTLVLNELSDLFTIVCRKKMNINKEKFTGEHPIYEFKDDKDTVFINEGNFDVVRRIILNQNMLHEPKIYKDKLVQEWAEKAKRAKARLNKSLDIFDVINIVSNSKKIPYKEVSDLNLLQLYGDYARIIHENSCQSSNVIKAGLLAGGGDITKLDRIDFTEGVIERLFENPDDKAFKDSEDSKLNGVLAETNTG